MLRRTGRSRAGGTGSLFFRISWPLPWGTPRNDTILPLRSSDLGLCGSSANVGDGGLGRGGLLIPIHRDPSRVGEGAPLRDVRYHRDLHAGILADSRRPTSFTKSRGGSLPRRLDPSRAEGNNIGLGIFGGYTDGNDLPCRTHRQPDAAHLPGGDRWNIHSRSSLDEGSFPGEAPVGAI